MSDTNSFGLSTTDPKLLKLLSDGGGISFKAFEEDILALSSIVAGTAYQNLTEIEKKITVHESKFILKREPDNQYDKFAVVVLFEDKKLGYIPKSKNQTIARLMDAGKLLFGKITQKEMKGKWLKIKMGIYLRN